MPDSVAHMHALKRRLRSLKKMEQRLRFSDAVSAHANAPRLVWNAYFDLREAGGGRARYTLDALAAMTDAQLGAVVDAYFFAVVQALYDREGAGGAALFDPALLARLGLPPEADTAAVKRRFRRLALETHPDTGGDAEAFRAVLEAYRQLMGE